MYTLLQKAVGYFSGAEVEAGLESNSDRPKLEDFLGGSYPETETFEGIVTSINNRDIIINNDIYFTIPLSQSKCKFRVGDEVQGVADRRTSDEAWRAVSLSLIVRKEGWGADSNGTSGEAISCRDLDAGIPGILKNDLFSPQTIKPSPPKVIALHKQQAIIEKPKTLVGQVIGVHADTITLNENTYFNLSSANLSFDLIKGDWVVCELVDDIILDATQRIEHLPGFVRVSQIHPLRKKKIRGNVTHCYPYHTVINNEVFCSNKLAKESSLRVGDSLIVEVIESSQCHFGWRALSLSCIAPSTGKELRSCILNQTSVKSLEGDIKITNLFEDKNDVVVSHSLRFPPAMLGSQTDLTVFLKNTGTKTQRLVRVYFVSPIQESQFSVANDSSRSQEDDNFVSDIMPNSTFFIKFHCKAKLLGLSKELCIFDLGSFHIGRYVSVSVGDALITNMAPNCPYVPQDRRNVAHIQHGDARIVKGEKPYRAPVFVPVSLPTCLVPQDLITLIEKGDDIVQAAPFLMDPILPENHLEKFSLLLHLEEIAMNLQMRQFDIMRTTFTSRGEYLSMTVLGLAEKRPSLMIGDTVIASNPCQSGETEYEGYIHEVLHTQILLKFHPSFHNQYRGEDYSVRFNFNRTPLRRCHFAIKFAMEQLGSDVLFPTKLKMQLPQVAYVDLEAEFPKQKNEEGVCSQAPKTVTSQDHLMTGKDIRNGSESVENSKEGPLNMNSKDSIEKLQLSSINENNRDYGLSYGKTNSIKSNGDIVKNVAPNSSKPLGKVNSSPETEKNYFSPKSSKLLNEISDSPNSSLRSAKNGNSATPPRIPVVTRLFGVPSSGSSANSSMCCSDDETKSDIDGDSKRTGSGKKPQVANTKTDVDGIIRELKHKNGSSEKILAPSRNHFSSGPIHKSTIVQNLFGSDNWVKQTERSKGVSQSKHSVVIIESERRDEDLKTESANSPPSFSASVLKNDHPQNPLSAKQRENTGKKSHRSSELSEETLCNGREITYLATGKSSYCVPVLPILFSQRKKVTNEVPVLEWRNKDLNYEQKLAVRRILEGSTRPLPYVIYGPPGTGKTVTLVEAVLQIFTLVSHSRILIVTPSNSAADLVTMRLQIHSQLKAADLVRLNAYQRKDDSIPEAIQSFSCNGDQLSVRVRQRIIVTTATTSGLLYTLALHNGHFSHVFVDEAGQLTEPECLVALGLVNSESGQVILAGDPQQLGPVVQSQLAKKYGLQESLLHRLCCSTLYQPEEESGSSAWIYEPRLVTRLVRNYRSHPDVFSVSSKLFYNGNLQSFACRDIQEKLLSWEELPKASCPILFHGLVSENLQEGDSPSWFNPTEAFQVVRYAKSLISFGLEAEDIGIITPYRKQVQKIRKLLTIFGIAEGIKVGTVEEFQGQEKTAVIISTVRSSEQLLEVDLQHSLGFVKCRRRFNVAITRAQSLLVVIGNPFLLLLDECWLEFITYCIKKGAYRGPELKIGDED